MRNMYLDHELTDQETDKLGATFLDDSHYNLLIEESANVYKPNGDILIAYRKHAINRAAVGPIYDPATCVKVDRDFTLQVIACGYQAIRIRDLAFAAPENGSNEGGLNEVYGTSGRELAAVRAMVAKWGPKICKHVVKPTGRHDCKINWEAARESDVSQEG